MTIEGLVTQASKHSPEKTVERLIAAIVARGMTVFARVDHSAAAAAARLELRPTEVLVFGQAKGGTPLMQAAQTAGIDLPLKALCWLDETGVVWVGYNDPLWLARRHGVEVGSVAAVEVMGDMLSALIRDVCAP